MHKMCKSDIGPSADTKHKLLNRETDGLGGGHVEVQGGRGSMPFPSERCKTNQYVLNSNTVDH